MAYFNDVKEKALKRCIMCEGDLEKANIGSICNACRDRMRK
jgi:hypothetical protein